MNKAFSENKFTVRASNVFVSDRRIPSLYVIYAFLFRSVSIYK